MRRPLQSPAFCSLGFTPRSGTAGSRGNSRFHFWRNRHTVLPSGPQCSATSRPQLAVTGGHAVRGAMVAGAREVSGGDRSWAGGGEGGRQKGSFRARPFSDRACFSSLFLCFPASISGGQGRRGAKPSAVGVEPWPWLPPCVRDLEHVTSLLWAQFPPAQWEVGPSCLRGPSCPSS